MLVPLELRPAHHQVVVLAGHLEVLLNELLEGRDLLEGRGADLWLGAAPAAAVAEVAGVAGLPAAGGGLAALAGVRAAGPQGS